MNNPCSGAGRRFDGVTRLQAREYLNPAGAPVVHVQPVPLRRHDGLHQNRHPDLRRLSRIDPGEPGGGHTDDRHRRVVDENLPADDSGVAGEPAHPVVVAENDDGVALVDLIVLLRVEDAPDGGLDPQHREVVPGYQLGMQPLGAVVDVDRGRDEPAAQDFGQRLGALLVVLVDRIGVHPGAHVAAVVRALLIEHDQLIWSCDRQLAQQHLVNERENGRICANSEGERQDGHNREQRAAAESPERKAKVGQQGIHRECFDGERSPTVYGSLRSARSAARQVEVARSAMGAPISRRFFGVTLAGMLCVQMR